MANGLTAAGKRVRGQDSRPYWREDVHFGRAVMVNPVGNALEKYMDLLSTRQKLIVSNIANADTPGYKTRDVDFQSEFQNLLNGGLASAPGKWAG